MSRFLRQDAVFTCLECAALLALLALLAPLALPLLADTRTDSERAGCFHNLRLLGRAITQWGDDCDALPTWFTLVSRGGTRPDTGVKVAAEFSNHGMLGYMGTVPVMAAVGDRNLRRDGTAQCSQGVNNADLINLQFQNPVLWTNAVHGPQGHFVRTDGSVVFSDSARLLADVFQLLDPNGSGHFLRAR